MPAVIAILQALGATVGPILLQMLMAMLTGPVIKRMTISYAKSQAKQYAEKAATTLDKQDDAKAEMFLDMVDNLNNAWFPPKA